MFVDETAYPESAADIVSRIESYLNGTDSAEDSNRDELMFYLAKAGVFAENGWYGHRGKYFLATYSDAETENEFLYEQYLDGLEDSNDCDEY